MKVAIDVLVAQQSKTTQKLVFVMGDMAELGEEAASMHVQIGQYAKQKAVSNLFSFGDFSQLASKEFGTGSEHFDSLEALVVALKTAMQADTCVLVKGSRSMKMERVVHAIVNTAMANSDNLEGVH